MLGLFETLVPSTILSYFGNLDPYRLHDRSGESPVSAVVAVVDGPSSSSSSRSRSSNSSRRFKEDTQPKSSSSPRKEGWTEEFGSRQIPSGSYWEGEEEYSQRMLQASPVFLTPNVMTLVQYRMAWKEQLTLRILNIPYTVINSNRFFTEMTGPLPYLVHPFTSNQDKKTEVTLIGKYDKSRSLLLDEDDPDPPAARSSTYSRTLSAIVDYVLLHTQSSNNKRSQDILSSSSNLEDHLYILWIQNYLDPILVFLRYGDWDMWEQVYKHQCVQAYVGFHSSNSSSPSRTLFSSMKRWLGRLQAQTERVVALKNLALDLHPATFSFAHYRHLNPRKDIQSVLNQARLYYSLLNTVLSSSLLDTKQDEEEDEDEFNKESSSKQKRCLSTSLGVYYPLLLRHFSKENAIHCEMTPSILVILLFSHLADALCNVHLVQVLADFPHLITLFQHMYTLYFGEFVDPLSSGLSNPPEPLDHSMTGLRSSIIERDRDSLHEWNKYVNASNAFQAIPSWGWSSPCTKTSSRLFQWTHPPKPESYLHAIQIMQRVAIHTTQDLVSIVHKISYEQEREKLLRISSSDTRSTTKTKSKNNTTVSQDTHETDDPSQPDAQNQMQRLMMDAQKKDQLWISGVAACTLLGYLITTLNKSGPA